ncbi:MAG: DUF192 domain-containing protein [Spirochaetaceae bacterium]|nr:DUF192 domain-containing protein [Spirochaetaceae bacterium]MDT8297265.1 DUF192 domain-containing protein [Spirochaetaceae bacterium]
MSSKLFFPAIRGRVCRGGYLTVSIILILSVFTAACSASSLPTVVLTVGGHEITAEVADSAEERATGLMNRKTLPEHHGMLFVFDTDSQVSFWMKNTLIPLSIAFISSDGTIRQIEDMEPGSLASTVSDRHVRYALEMNQGWFEENGVGPGDPVVFPKIF